MSIAQKIIEAHKFKFGSHPPLQQCSVSGSALFNADCMDILPLIPNKSIQLNITDIPYGSVNRKSNGIRNLDKGKADIIEFDLNYFLIEIERITEGISIIFCGKEQFSEIYSFFAQQKGTVRPIIWNKTNPSPMNGQHIYLSGVELGVWFKRSGYKTFNAHCKNTVFSYPNGRSKNHPTEKNHQLIEILIMDNSNENDTILDACMGSGTHCLKAKELNRKFIGIEKEVKYYDLAVARVFG